MFMNEHLHLIDKNGPGKEDSVYVVSEFRNKLFWL